MIENNLILTFLIEFDLFLLINWHLDNHSWYINKKDQKWMNSIKKDWKLLDFIQKKWSKIVGFPNHLLIGIRFRRWISNCCIFIIQIWTAWNLNCQTIRCRTPNCISLWLFPKMFCCMTGAVKTSSSACR